MNVVLVVFDSLRKDCIGRHGSPFWGRVRTPNFDALAAESLVFTQMWPESLPTLPTRRALYTGRRVYPFEKGDFRLKGDFVGAAGWGPIPEDQPTVAEVMQAANYRTALIADVYHMFKPSKNYWRGFGQWTFLRGQETDPSRSGPLPSQAEIEYWLPVEVRTEQKVRFIRQCLLNMIGRVHEEDWFNARVLCEAGRWLEQNRDAKQFFLVVESFDPHEPWFVPEQYRRMYDPGDGREQVCSGYHDVSHLPAELVRRTQANYSGLVTMCDRWFGHFMDTLRSTGRLDDTLLIFTTDHGHSIGDRGYLGKRGYPSAPEVYEVPLFIRHPEGLGAGRTTDLIVQHHDLPAAIYEATGVTPPAPLDGRPFYRAALEDRPPDKPRDHVTVGWGGAVTVIKDGWWLNCKVNGTGVFLHKPSAVSRQPSVTDKKSKTRKEMPGSGAELVRDMGENLADKHPDIVRELFALALADAGGRFPDWLLDLARRNTDAPGCSAIAART